MHSEAAARPWRRARRLCARVRSSGNEPAGLTRAGVRAAPQITGLPEQDVLFVRFEADVSGRACLPYFIALDRTTRSIGAAAPRLLAGAPPYQAVRLPLFRAPVQPPCQLPLFGCSALVQSARALAQREAVCAGVQTAM